MGCRHRLFVWTCHPCRRASENLHVHVCGERERHTLKLLAEQRRLDDEGVAYEPGELGGAA